MKKHIISTEEFCVIGMLLISTSLASAQDPFSDKPIGMLAQAASGNHETAGVENRRNNSGEAVLVEKFLAQNVDYDELMALVPGIPQELREKLLDKMRFAIVQENRQDLKPVMDGLVKAAPAKPQLSTDNMLKIPMRPGKLEISAMFIKKYGTIIQSDRSRFQATLDTINVDVVPDVNKPGRVLASFSGTTASGQLPQAPIGGSITSDGTTATISTDDGRWIKIVVQSNGNYKISSDKLPVTATAKYCD